MNEKRKKISIVLITVMICIVVLLLLFCFFISPKYIYLNAYNDGKSGFVNINDVKKITLIDSGNKESQLKKIKKCKNLNELVIEYCIDDLYSFSDLSVDNLCFLSDCKNWDSIRSFKQIRRLSIIPVSNGGQSTFKDCSILEKFKSLEELEVNNFTDEINFSGLEKLTNLKTLKISSDKIDFSKIPISDNVENITLYFGYDEGNYFPENIECLQDSKVKTLSFRQSYIEDVSFVNSISNISVIEFHDCIFAMTESEVKSLTDKLIDSDAKVSFNDCQYNFKEK